MRRSLLSATVVLTAALSLVFAKELPKVTFESPGKCTGDHGVWRWSVKIDDEAPPETIPKTNRLTPPDIGDWEAPEEKLGKDTARVDREKDWFELTGRVVLVRAEADGDLHIQLEDADGEGNVEVVVEVPASHHSKTAPWADIRATVFGWTSTKFPFTTTRGRKLKLLKNPVIRVVGKAFYDAKHAKKDTPNRRINEPKTTVWEIHPVMRLEVLGEKD